MRSGVAVGMVAAGDSMVVDFLGGSMTCGVCSAPGGFSRVPGWVRSSEGYAGGYRAGYGGGRIAYAPRYGVQGRAFGGGVGVSGGAAGRFITAGGIVRRRGYGYGVGYGVGYGYGPWDYGWLDADDTDYGDDGGYDVGPGVGPYDDGSGVAAEGYGPPGYGPQGYDRRGRTTMLRRYRIRRTICGTGAAVASADRPW